MRSLFSGLARAKMLHPLTTCGAGSSRWVGTVHDDANSCNQTDLT
jgi:hypothetical protein